MRRCLVVVAVCCASLAACGSSSGGSAASFKSAYASVSNRTQPVGPQLEQALANAGQLTNGALATEMRSYADKVSAIRADFARLHPPASARALMTQYLGDIGRIAGDLDAIANEASTNDPTGAKATALTLGNDLKASSGVKQQLDKLAGYTPPSSG